MSNTPKLSRIVLKQRRFESARGSKTSYSPEVRLAELDLPEVRLRINAQGGKKFWRIDSNRVDSSRFVFLKVDSTQRKSGRKVLQVCFLVLKRHWCDTEQENCNESSCSLVLSIWRIYTLNDKKITWTFLVLKAWCDTKQEYCNEPSSSLVLSIWRICTRNALFLKRDAILNRKIAMNLLARLCCPFEGSTHGTTRR